MKTRKFQLQRDLNLNNIFNTIIASMSFGFRMILSCYSPWTLSSRNWPCLAHLLLLLLPLQLVLNSTRSLNFFSLFLSKNSDYSFCIFSIGP
ncbi:hexokinase-1 protein [Trifolium repens]|nr:hexokinase-1 protein [Trifolium repens]